MKLLSLIFFVLFLWLGETQYDQKISKTNPIMSMHAPILRATASEGFLFDSATLGTNVRTSPSTHSGSLQIVVEDDDLKLEMPSAIYEYILTGVGAAIFAVDQNGFIYLNAPRLETRPPSFMKYQLTVVAREVNTSPVRSSEPITITINILDVDGNLPMFTSPIYSTATATFGPEREVVQVSAISRNSYGAASNNVYSIVSVSDDGLENFRLDQSSGKLFAVGSLQPNTSYQIVVEATDTNGFSNQALIVVRTERATPNLLQRFVTDSPFSNRFAQAGVIASNQNVQTIVVNVSEATPPNSIIASLEMNRKDDRIYHRVVDGNSAGKFAIDPQTGAIISIGSFDREQASMYNLQIETRSKIPDQHLYWTVVQVIVDDVNDNAPKFLQSQPIRIRADFVNINDERADLVVGHLDVNDSDNDDNGKVQLKILPPMDKLFAINNDGVLFINGRLLKGHIGEHRLEVVASDLGDPPMESRATIIVTIAGNIQASDTQINQDAHIWPHMKHESIKSGPEEGFSHTPMDNRLAQSRPAFNAAGSMVDLRLAPIFSPSSIKLLVIENQSNMELVKLNAFYNDGAQGPITYLIETGDTSIFRVDSRNGSLYLLKKLDAEAKNSYNVKIGTAQANNLRNDPELNHYANVLLIVDDVNDNAPKFKSNGYEFSAKATSRPGTPIGAVSATDADSNVPNNQIEYSLLGEDGPESYFSIDPTSGVISIKKNTENLTSQIVTLQIKATDHGTPPISSQSVALVNIENVVPLHSEHQTLPRNEFVQFSQKNYSISVSEGIRPPYLVQVIPVVNKPDDGRYIVCSIINGNDKHEFGISVGASGNCELRSQTILDREKSEYYSLNISVQSDASNVDYAQLAITIADRNDNAPEILTESSVKAKLFSTLLQKAISGTNVTSIMAIDADTGANAGLKYTIDRTSPDRNHFEITHNGNVILKNDLEPIIQAGHQPFFELKINVCDEPETEESLCTSKDLYINVLNAVNRFVIIGEHTTKENFLINEKNFIETLQRHTAPCSLINIEKVKEKILEGASTQLQIYMYAINPTSNKICKKWEFRQIFSENEKATISNELSKWFTAEQILDVYDGLDYRDSIELRGTSGDMKITTIASISISLIIATSAFISICVILLLYCRSNKKGKKETLYPAIHRFSKIQPPFFSNTSFAAPNDIFYETQVFDMPIGIEDYVEPSSKSVDPYSTRLNGGQKRYGNNYVDEGDFSIEESMISMDLQPGDGTMIKKLTLPAPDYMNARKSHH